MKFEETVVKYKCDSCTKVIDAEEANGWIRWNIGWFGADAAHDGMVFVGDYQSYGHEASKSHLCNECKKQYLEKALKIIEQEIAKKKGK